jgi:hypothetical protein
METHDRSLLDQWIANWSDIVDFENFPVITSEEAAQVIAPRLRPRRSMRELGYALAANHDWQQQVNFGHLHN